jgi:archaellin
MQIIAHRKWKFEICNMNKFNIKDYRLYIELCKKLFLLGFLLVSKMTYAQHAPQFELTKAGVEPLVVIVDSLNARQLYKKTINWVQVNYKSPAGVLKVDIKNETVRIEDIKNNVWFSSSPDTTFYYDVEYIFTMNFEDNKITMSFDFGNTWNRSAQNASHSYCINYKKIWKQNGELHTIYKETKPGIDLMMNELSLSLINHLRNDKKNIEEEKQSDWLRLRNKVKLKVIN